MKWIKINESNKAHNNANLHCINESDYYTYRDTVKETTKKANRILKKMNQYDLYEFIREYKLDDGANGKIAIYSG